MTNALPERLQHKFHELEWIPDGDTCVINATYGTILVPIRFEGRLYFALCDSMEFLTLLTPQDLARLQEYHYGEAEETRP